MVTTFTADTTAATDDERPLAVANVYASLKEIDAVMANPAQYPIGLPFTSGTPRLAPYTQQRPLDYLLITGDAMKPAATIPADTLAEAATSWVLSYVNNRGPSLEPLAPPLGKAERFEGYTTFNISKLGLPVAAAIDLIGAQLARQILAGMLSTRDDTSAEQWAATAINAFKQTLAYDTIYDQPRIHERMADMARRITPEAISAEVKSKDKEFSMRAFAEAVIKRLEHEDRAVDMIDQGHTAIRLETLRTRSEDTLDELQRKLATNIGNLTTLLSCQQGSGLQWTVIAMEQLSRRLNETLNKCREQASVADDVWQETRRRVVNMGQEHDDTYSGIKRRLRGSAAKDLQELSISFDYGNTCAADRIRWSSSAVACQRNW